MRQRKIKVRKYSDSNRKHLRFVVNYREAGKRKRTFFETKEAANKFVAFKNDELKRNGVEHAEFPTSLRVMAQNAVEKLKPFGKTIADAVTHYVAHLKATERSCNAEQLAKELLAAKKADGIGERHLQDIRSRLGVFAEKFDGQAIATITSAQIDDWLRSLPVAPTTRNHYRTVVGLAFNYAIGRRYAVENPAEQTTKVKEPHREIGILTITQATRLLGSTAPDLLPYVAIALFAGLRPSEIERLDWSDINFDSGLIKVEAVKGTRRNTRRRRFVKIMPNLRDWLLPFRKLKGHITPQTKFRQFFDQARETAELLAHWKEDAMRHSFASYHLAHFKDENALALEMGNSPDVIIARYRELVTPKEAARFWEIKPSKRARKIVPFAAAR
jgi:integrase